MSRVIITGMVLVMLALAGCGTTTNLVAVSNDIQSAGYAFASLHIESGGDTVLAVDTTTATGAQVTKGDANEIAAIVWRKYDGSFDRLRIAINGTTVLLATEDELAEQLGDRPDDLPMSGDGTKLVMVVVGTTVAGLLVGAFVYFVWWRGRKPPRRDVTVSQTPP